MVSIIVLVMFAFFDKTALTLLLGAIIIAILYTQKEGLVGLDKPVRGSWDLVGYNNASLYYVRPIIVDNPGK